MTGRLTFFIFHTQTGIRVALVTKPSCLSMARLNFFSVFLLPSFSGGFAFVGSPTAPASSATRPCTPPQNVRSAGPSRSSSRTARMSTSPDVPAAEAVGEVEGRRVDPYVTELPDSFEDSIVRMGRSTLQCMETVRRGGAAAGTCPLCALRMMCRQSHCRVSFGGPCSL